MTREAIHPGEFLADELEEIAMTRTELARQIDVPANRISQLIHGKCDLTADTALRLFSTGPELFLNVHEFVTLHDAREKLRAWQEDYNHHRPHGSLGHLTPSEFVKKRSAN